MAAFGYGSAYSFNNMGQNDMLGGTSLSSNPRSIVPSSQSKGAIQSGPTELSMNPSGAMFNSGNSIMNPYGIDFSATPAKDPGGATWNGGMARQGDMDFKTYDVSEAWRLAYGLGSGANLAAGDMGNLYGEAFNQLNWDKSSVNGLAYGDLLKNAGYGAASGMTFDQFQTNLQNKYNAWVSQMMNSGAYGLGGSTSYGGGY